MNVSFCDEPPFLYQFPSDQIAMTPMRKIGFVILCGFIIGSAGTGCAAAKPLEFGGEINRGETLVHRFENRGTLYEFRLVPSGGGWTIWIDEPDRRDRNYVAAVTPPFRGVNPAVIEAWHFSNQRESEPNVSNDGISAPQKERRFSFVPGATAYQEATEALGILLHPENRTEDEIRDAEMRLSQAPRIAGVLRIEAIAFGTVSKGDRPYIEHMAFRVTLDLP